MATMAAAAAPVAAHRCAFSGNDGMGRATVCRHSVRFGAQKRHAVRKMRSFVVLAASAGEDEVAVLDGAPKEEPKLNKKPSPLERGGTLIGDAAEGMDPSPATLGKSNTGLSSGKFEDPRWKNGTWDLMQFAKDGKMDWDAVIDAEVLRRKWLEQNPEASSNDDPVVFDTATVPWWAWVKRFHLPEAELLNGRAAMLGFFAAYLIDSLTGVGLVDQTNSFFGKLLLFITVVGVLLIRRNEDITTLKKVVKESTFYDKQWQASWKDEPKSEEK